MTPTLIPKCVFKKVLINFCFCDCIIELYQHEQVINFKQYILNITIMETNIQIY